MEAYFKGCHELPLPTIAFTATTERLWGRGNPDNLLFGFPTDMPYFCLRVPNQRRQDWLADDMSLLADTAVKLGRVEE